VCRQRERVNQRRCCRRSRPASWRWSRSAGQCGCARWSRSFCPPGSVDPVLQRRRRGDDLKVEPAGRSAPARGQAPAAAVGRQRVRRLRLIVVCRARVFGRKEGAETRARSPRLSGQPRPRLDLLAAATFASPLYAPAAPRVRVNTTEPRLACSPLVQELLGGQPRVGACSSGSRTSRSRSSEVDREVSRWPVRRADRSCTAAGTSGCRVVAVEWRIACRPR